MAATEMLDNTVNQIVLNTYKSGNIPTKKKCCGKCAFRAGSPERSDPWGWMKLVDDWDDGKPFFCHEGIEGHKQAVAGESIHLCTGFQVTRNTPSHMLLDLAHMKGPEPKPEFLIGFDEVIT